MKGVKNARPAYQNQKNIKFEPENKKCEKSIPQVQKSRVCSESRRRASPLPPFGTILCDHFMETPAGSLPPAPLRSRIRIFPLFSFSLFFFSFFSSFSLSPLLFSFSPLLFFLSSSFFFLSSSFSFSLLLFSFFSSLFSLSFSSFFLSSSSPSLLFVFSVLQFRV